VGDTKIFPFSNYPRDPVFRPVFPRLTALPLIYNHLHRLCLFHGFIVGQQILAAATVTLYFRGVDDYDQERVVKWGGSSGRVKAWKARNPEAVREQQASYYQRNRQKRLRYASLYRSHQRSVRDSVRLGSIGGVV